MPKEFVVGDTSYHFPDNYSDQQVQSILAKQGVIKLPEASPMAKAGHAFVEGLGIPAMLDIIGASNRHGTPQEIASRADKQKAALQGIVQGIVGEPGRVWGELSRTGESMLKGDLGGTAYHLAGAVPLFGAPAQQVAQDLQRGDPAAAVGHTAALVAPFLAGPAARAAGRGIATTGTVARGAVSGTVKAIPAAVGGALEKSLYGAFAGPEGMLAAAKVGGLKELGQGAVTGARAALAERAAKAAAAAPVEYPAGSMATISPDYYNVPPARSPLFPVPDTVPPAAPHSPLFPDLPPRPRSPLFPNLPPPESGPPAAPAPEPAPVVPPTGGKPAAADLAAQLEASMRAETLTDYLVRNKVPAAMLDDFGPEQWDMVSRQAGVKPPSLEDVAAIRGNLAQYEGASEITAKTPAEAAAEFEAKKATRNARKPKAAAAPPADVEAQLADSLSKVEKGERPVAQVADEGAAKPTASEVRVNAFAERLAAERDISLEDLGTIAQNPEALRYMDNLGRSMGIQGSLAPGDVAQIVARVEELRGAPAPAAPTTLRDLMQPKAAGPPAPPRARRSKPVR